MNISVLKCLLMSVACCLIFLRGSASGAGFAVAEQSVKGLGTAFSAGAAGEDASTIFYNPAGLVRLSGSQVVSGLHLILPSARFRDEGSYHVTGLELTGKEGENAGTAMFVPNLYYSPRITDRFSAGIGIFSPFGLSTDYDLSWVGRYHAVESVLKTLNINPAAALRLTNRLSFGAGVNIQYAKAELSNAIDFGTIFGTLGMPGMAPQGNDGFVTFKGDGWSWGYNLGFLYEINDRTRTGIAYRSRIRQTLEGDADFSRVPSPNPIGRFLDTGIRSSVTFPDSLSLNIWHNFSKEFAIMADLTWTNWSTFKEIRIKFDNPVESDAVTTMAWKDRYRFSVGAVYMPDDWTFRTGVAFDPTPIPDAAHRTPRIPDSHRTWIALGLGRNLGDRLSFDLGYAHLFANDPEIRKTPTGEDRLRGGLSGSYKGRVDIFSIELTWRF